MLLPKKVFIDEKSHTYYDKSDIVYQSVSRFIEGFSDPFDRLMIAQKTAEKRRRIVEEEARIRNVSPSVIKMGFKKFERGTTKEEVLQEWEDKSKEATDAGTYVHKVIENFVKEGIISDERYKDYCVFIQKILNKYEAFHPEEILYNDHWVKAGMADLILQRSKSLKTPIDITDYKTNYDNFTYNSKSVDQYTSKVKNNNRYFNAPMDHLEKSYYTKTCLQLSMYMWMLEQHGFRPGSLFVILLDWKLNNKPKVVHVPYMKLEIEAMLKYEENLSMDIT